MDMLGEIKGFGIQLRAVRASCIQGRPFRQGKGERHLEREKGHYQAYDLVHWNTR